MRQVRPVLFRRVRTLDEDVAPTSIVSKSGVARLYRAGETRGALGRELLRRSLR